MSLADEFAVKIAASMGGLYVQSYEHEDAIEEMRRVCCDPENQWEFATFDVDRGMQIYVQAEEGWRPVSAYYQQANVNGQLEWQVIEGVTNKPDVAVKSLPGMNFRKTLGDPADSENPGELLPAVLVVKNFHHALKMPAMAQLVANRIVEGRQHRQTLVILSPVVELPPELEKLFESGHITHALPDREQIKESLLGVADIDDFGEDGIEMVIDAAAGLTRMGIEDAAAQSLVVNERVCPRTIWHTKAEMLRKASSLNMYQGEDTFATLGGLDSLKDFCVRSIAKQGSENEQVRPRGVMLLSPPGCGKSQFCKCLGNETGRPTLILDIGALMGSLVGQTEERTRAALATAEAMAPCVLMVDEIEKALSGVAGSGKTDSGVSARMFGSLLTWLNDHTSDVYFIATCNDISQLPPEFTRAERFDGVFFVDLPGEDQRNVIWDIYIEMFELDPKQKRPRDKNWTGAEIRACCRLAALLDTNLLEASENVVPIAVTAKEQVDGLREWATGRCLSADYAGIYKQEAHAGRLQEMYAGNGQTAGRRSVVRTKRKKA